MGKSRNSRADKEYSTVQKLTHENRELKRSISKLRKQLARIDLDRYTEIRDIVEQSYAAEDAAEAQKVLKDLRKQWTCHECGDGLLEICLYNKISETWYYRQCSKCPHRTKSQKYDPSSVSGPLRTTESPARK